MVHSILERISKDKIRRDSFPISIIEGALPEDYYEELSSSLPPLDYVTGDTTTKNNTAYHRIAPETVKDAQLPAIWQDFIAYHCSKEFFEKFCDVWGADVAAAHPDFLENFGKPLEDFTVGMRYPGKGKTPQNLNHDIMLDCQFCYNSPVTKPSVVRGPHLDSPFKLFAALLYMRHPDDHSTGGDLDIYRLRDGCSPRPRPGRIHPRNVERQFTIPYRANTLIIWINSPAALHGVTPRSVTEVPRRYMNFLGECYRGHDSDYFIAGGTRVGGFWHEFKHFRRRFKKVRQIGTPAD